MFFSVLDSKNSMEFFLVNPFSTFYFVFYQNKKVNTVLLSFRL
jgi:hypothetical protein